jgi:hypothetical protein
MSRVIKSKLLTGNKESDKVHLKATMELNNVTGQYIANKCGITPQAVSGVINRKFTLKKVIVFIENLPRQVQISEK